MALSGHDLDIDGKAFATVALPLLAAAPARWVLGTVSGIPYQGTSLTVVALLGLALLLSSLALSGRGFREASVVARALFLVVAAQPFAIEAMLACIHMGRNVPYRDGLLASWDAAIGFDWKAYARAFDSSPCAWWASQVSYRFMAVQVPLAICVLAFSRQATRLYAYVAASALALSACCVLVGFFPALGAYAHAGGASAGFVHSDFTTADGMRATLEALRQDHVVGRVKELGLISFPSYHSVCAVLGAWAFWRVRGLRWVVLGCDVAMLASTPIQGSHYLCDILAGVAIATVAIAASRGLLAILPGRPADNAGTATARGAGLAPDIRARVGTGGKASALDTAPPQVA